jgi:glycogen debranching enzyme
MPAKSAAAHKATRRQPISKKSRQARKAQVLTRGVPSITASIADALSIKDENIFLVTEADGSIPVQDGHGFGLYYHDCRYLDAYQLQIADAAPIVLAGVTGSRGCATLELTNPHLEFPDGKQLPSGEIGIAWDRQLDPDGLRLIDHISIKNYSLGRVTFPFTLTFGSLFDDVFAVRGLFDEHPGKLHAPQWVGDKLAFSYDGADGYARTTRVEFSPKPDVRRENAVSYGIALDRLETCNLRITVAIKEVKGQKARPPSGIAVTGPAAAADPKEVIRADSASWFHYWPAIQSDSPLLNQVIERANRDLQSLWSSIRGQSYIAAGVPWFSTLFGRDSIITALQMLPIKPNIAAQTLRLLATYQARETDSRRDAQPGKILHELRVGELAATGSIPHSPYYGTVDATPLFIVLMDEYVAWTGDLDLFRELREHIELAMQWIDQYGDSDGDGYVDYKTASDMGLRNQGWKDSIDSIMNADGSFATPPIALVEVQGYVYRARLALADLYRRLGETGRADALRKTAEAFQARFNQDFWNAKLGFYSIALQAGGKPAAVVSSNPGQALWSGIVDPARALQTVRRLMARDMFSGWGIRTLSQREKGYNPIGYHVGSIWPHDNAMIADGFRRYGFYDEAMQVFNGVLAAAMNFNEFQLPELYSGFSREQYSVPVHYPAACHPQAWAAGSIPYLIFGALGLQPHASGHMLEVRHAMLPDSVNWLDIAGLRVGELSVDIRLGRAADGHTVVQAVRADPGLQVNIR